MPITVNTNMSSLICQRSLTKATSGMNTALQRMSTGLKINSAKDDAAGCAISSKMDYKLSSYGVAQDNAQMGQSMLDTASGSLSVMNGMLQRMRDLSEQAANGTYGKEERQAMQAEVDALTKELYRIKNTTDFNGKKVLGTEDVQPLSESEAVAQGYTVVKTAQELKDVFYNDDWSVKTGSNSAKVMLFADIDMNELKVDDTNNWVAVCSDPTGSYVDNYAGKFDGNGFTISNLKINNTLDRQGLFSATLGAEIKNINLENVSINASTTSGGLVGRAGDTKFENCNVSGNIDLNIWGAGGVLGFGVGKVIINNCTSTANVNSRQASGGIVGQIQSDGCEINNCYTEGAVGTNDNGGIVGILKNGVKISNCTANCNVLKANNNGGIVGNDYNSQGIYSNNQWVTTKNPNITQGVGNRNITDETQIKGITSIKKSENSICKVNLQVGIDSDSNSVITTDTGFKMGDFKVSLGNEHSARKALDKIDAMMAKVNAKQLDIGATSTDLQALWNFNRCK